MRSLNNCSSGFSYSINQKSYAFGEVIIFIVLTLNIIKDFCLQCSIANLNKSKIILQNMAKIK